MFGRTPRLLLGGVCKTALCRNQRSGTKPHGADRAGAGEAKRRDRETESRHQMEWVRQMNACKAQAEEVVKTELIYD